MLFYYIRHGDPIYEPDSLTELGRKQAEALSNRLCTQSFDRIFTSSSTRAKQTAEPTCEKLKMNPVVLDFCNEKYAWEEFAFPDSTGKKQWIFCNDRFTPILASEKTFLLGKKWYEHPDLIEYGFQSGLTRIGSGIDALLLSLGFRHNTRDGYFEAVNPTCERVALFAHHGFGLMFLSHLLDIPVPQLTLHFDIGHSDMTVIDFNESNRIITPRVLTLSNDSHLYKEGLSLEYNYKTIL